MRKNVGLIGILVFVWLSMLLGFVIIFNVIIPLTDRIPIPGSPGNLIKGIIKVGTSGALAVSWLQIWKKIEYNYFWRTIKRKC